MQQGQQVTKFPIDFDKIAQIIATVIVMYLISAVFNFLQQFIMTRVSQRTVYELRHDLEAKMNRVPISYYDTHTNGDIMSRAINDMDNIASTLQQNLTQFVTSAVTLIGVIVMMLSISWQLTLVALLMIPLSLIIVMVIRLLKHSIILKKIRKYLKKKIRICMPLVGKLNLFRQSSCR